MENNPLLFGTNIDWDKLHMWRANHLTSLGSIVEGKAVPPGSGQPYGLLTVEMPKLSGHTTALVALTHREDFLNAWMIFNDRGLAEDEELLVSYCPPQKLLFRLAASILPRLMFQVYSAGNLERRMSLSGDEMAAMEANHEEPRHIVCPRTSLP